MYAFIGLEGLKSIGEDVDMIDEDFINSVQDTQVLPGTKKILWQPELLALRNEDLRILERELSINSKTWE